MEVTGVASQRLRVCLVNSVPDWGGGERVFVELAAGLRAADHRVTLVCRPGSILRTRAPAAIEVVPLRLTGYFDVATLVHLLRLFRATEFDAVICNTGRDCFLAGLAAIPASVPVIRIRQLEQTRRSMHRLFIHRVLLSTVVSVSRAAQAGLTPLGIAPERLCVIHNGVEVKTPTLDRAQAREQFGVPEAAFLVAYTGRLSHEKGVDLLPDVAARLRAAGVPLRLLVAGEGPLHDTLAQQCRQRGLGDVVSLVGFLNQPEGLLAAADAAVMPSRRESFGVAAIEALATGTPLVATDVGGLAEIVAHEETALLVPPDDSGAIASALERLYRDSALAARLRERGRVRAREFSRERMVAQYEALIRRLRQQRRR